LSSSTNADSEILGLAVDPTNNFLYATGYETVNLGTPRQHLFVLKFDNNGALLWKRTYNGGFGDDRGGSILINNTIDPSHIYVYGESTVAVGNVDVFYLRLI